MADEIAKIDSNNKPVSMAITDDANQYIKMLRIDDTTKGLKVMIAGGVGAGTVTKVSVVTANGISGTVATDTTTPAITLSLGAITPSSVNGLTITANGTNTLNITAGKTLTVQDNVTITGALGTGAYATIADYAPVGQTFYIGTTQVAINRASAALTLAGITLTTPDIGTPSAGTLTNCSGYANDLSLPAGKQITLTAPTGDDTATGFATSAFNSGYTTSAIGDLVYLDSSATWQLVDVDSTTTSYGLIGIALEAKASGNALKVALPGSFVRHNAWNWTPGATLYASETAGGIATTIPTGADNVIRVIGFAVNADYIYFYPSQDVQTTVA